MVCTVSTLWQSPPPDLSSRIDGCFAASLERVAANDPGYVFFRADDVAAPGTNLVRLVDLFTRYRIPLCLAVVPAWLTQARWRHLQRIGQKASPLWCWHQHGWRHINHEQEGKNAEFGPSRPPLMIHDELVRGKRRLQTLMGDSFSPFFTPPWNRCGQDTLALLKELHYKALSRSEMSQPPPPEGLPDFAVHVDLHTRKEKDPVLAWENLFSELRIALSRNRCGIMIHHQRMNEAAFVFLEIFIRALLRQPHLHPVHFGHLLAVYH